MSEKLLLPRIQDAIANLSRRVGILERRIGGAAAGATGTPANDDIIFTQPGSLISGVEAPPAKLRYGGFLASMAIALGTAGSTATTLEVKRNGTVVATIVVPSGSADFSAEIGARVNPEDRITVKVVTAGTGAGDMTAAARFT